MTVIVGTRFFLNKKSIFKIGNIFSFPFPSGCLLRKDRRPEGNGDRCSQTHWSYGTYFNYLKHIDLMVIICNSVGTSIGLIPSTLSPSWAQWEVLNSIESIILVLNWMLDKTATWQIPIYSYFMFTLCTAFHCSDYCVNRQPRAAYRCNMDNKVG